jgi:glycosidase
LEFGKVINNTTTLTRTDYENAVIYNVFVDRFFDGNPDNNRPINNPQLVNPKADFQGGDIAGILQKANEGFFDSLGINTIWISPIVKNVEGAYGHWNNPDTKFSAYHGYWPISLTEIDDRFGTSDDFYKLVENLHNTNKNIILDFVAHHVHEKSKIYQEHKDWTTNLYLPDGSLNTERWDDYRLTTWFDVFLPTLDNSRPEVYNFVSDSAIWWVKTYDIDGFRHDAAKHVPLIFWRTLTYKLKKQIEVPKNKRLYQIGETYGTPELVSSYVNSGMLDAQFDFNLYDAISTALTIGNSFKTVENQLLKSFKYYGWHNLMEILQAIRTEHVLFRMQVVA